MDFNNGDKVRTREEIENEIVEFLNTIEDANKRIAELKVEFCETAKFKSGTKVIVRGKTCFIRQSFCDVSAWRKNAKMNYSFLKMKKDGTCGAVSAGIYASVDDSEIEEVKE